MFVSPSLDSQTLIPNNNLESLINLLTMSLDWGKNPEYPEKTQTNKGKTCRWHQGHQNLNDNKLCYLNELYDRVSSSVTQ